MRTVRAWLHRARGLAGARRREPELAQELEGHLHMHIDDNIRAGMSPDEARRAASVGDLARPTLEARPWDRVWKHGRRETM